MRSCEDTRSDPSSLRNPAQQRYRTVDREFPRAVSGVGLGDDASHRRRDGVVECVPVLDFFRICDTDVSLGVLVLVAGRGPRCRYAPVDDPREEGRDAVVV